MTRSMTTRGPRTAAALITCIAATLLLAPAARADILAPTVPGDLRTAAVSSTSVDLSWNAATDDVGVTGYPVYSDGIAIGTPPSTSFSDATVVAGTTYEYSVDAVDAAQNHSAQSAPLTVTVVAPVTVESLCQDTVAALKSSPKYPANQPAVDAAASRLVQRLGLDRAATVRHAEAQPRRRLQGPAPAARAFRLVDRTTGHRRLGRSRPAPDRLTAGFRSAGGARFIAAVPPSAVSTLSRLKESAR